MSPDHYFSMQPSTDDARRVLAVRLAGRNVQVDVASGVFSPSRVDLGTRVLLRTIPPLPDVAAHVLDLGCGWGPLALTMGLQAPSATIWAVDVNERALDLTRGNAARLHLGNIRTALPDDVPVAVRFAQIWSNPPIRVGKEALHEMLLRWLPRLTPGGVAYLVIQRHLGADSLHRWLAEALAVPMPGVTVEREGSAKGYRVLTVHAGPAR